MKLPQELKRKIAGCLEKEDLKMVRLVSKDWSWCTTSFLFDRIYWSPQDLDLVVFANVVNNTTLANNVTELEVDGSQFGVYVSERKYFEDLCLQVEGIIWRVKEVMDGQGLISPMFQGIDPQILALAQMIDSPSVTVEVEELWKTFSDSSFVKEGYCKYVACAQKQRDRLHDPSVLEHFRAGLAGLNNLNSVILSHRWSPYPGLRRYDPQSSEVFVGAVSGSPLARSWDVFHLQPSAWKFQEGRNDPVTFDGSLELFFMSLALFQAGKKPRQLRLGSIDWSKSSMHEEGPIDEEGCPPLFTSDTRSLEKQNDLLNAYHGLTHLTLHMATFESVNMPLVYSDLQGLGRFLGSLTELNCLELILPTGTPDQLYTYDQIFSRYNGRWPKLHTLYVQNLAIGTEDLVGLFQGMPILRSLTVCMIVLLSGKWEGIMEFLHHHMQLESFEILSDSDRGGSLAGLLYPTGEDYSMMSDKYMHEVMQYVVRRRGCPTWRDGEDGGLARRYLAGLGSFPNQIV